ncbi:MAG: hypothetical protein ACR2QC_08085 [Gammaproteobacteria bacterium]
MHTFEGGTTTPKASFTDSTAGTTHPNPVILDSSGRAQIWIQGTPYKFRIDDSTDVTILTIDNIPATSQLAGGSIGVRTSATTTLACSSGAEILTANSILPAKARAINVFTENLIAPGTSNGLSGYDIGSHGIEDRWGANIPLTLSNKTDIGDFQLNTTPISSATSDVNIVPRGGAFDGTGSIEVTVEYETGTAA